MDLICICYTEDSLGQQTVLLFGSLNVSKLLRVRPIYSQPVDEPQDCIRFMEPDP